MRGEDADLEAVCRRVYPSLLSVLSFQVGSTAVAEELAQQTLARMWDRWRRVRELDAPDEWAHQMALELSRSGWRQWRARRRARRRSSAGQDDVVGDEVDPGLRQVVRGLPRRQREALVLVVVAGRSTVQAAEVMGCRPDTVKELCIRARQQLRAGYGHGADHTAGGGLMAAGLDDRLRGSAAVPRAELDVADVGRRARRLRWSRRLRWTAGTVVLAGLAILWLGVVQAL